MILFLLVPVWPAAQRLMNRPQQGQKCVLSKVTLSSFQQLKLVVVGQFEHPLKLWKKVATSRNIATQIPSKLLNCREDLLSHLEGVHGNGGGVQPQLCMAGAQYTIPEFVNGVSSIHDHQPFSRLMSDCT